MYYTNPNISYSYMLHERLNPLFPVSYTDHATDNLKSFGVKLFSQKRLLAFKTKKKHFCLVLRLSEAMPRLSENQRNQAIGMLQAGARIMDVAQHFGCSRQTIHNLSTRFGNTGSVHDRPRPGAPRLTSRRDDRVIGLNHLRNMFCQLQLLLVSLV